MVLNMLSFDEAVGKASKTRHVLLGNGFSIACRSNIFTYGKLIDQADFTKLSPAARLTFDELGTTDFEIVIEALKRAGLILGLYSDDNKALIETVTADANGLREVLVSAVAGSHPNRPNDIHESEYECCKTFLQHFQRIYTLNYDMLLYWTLMNDGPGPSLNSDDGFRQPDDGVQEWVTWESSAHSQNTNFLHGALHIYNAGSEIQKYTWCNTGRPLLDQIRAALEQQKYPIFVAEGTSDQKMARINRSSFLGRAYRSFESITGTLFAYGMSFGESDRHIMRAIAHGKVEQFFVSIFGDPDSTSNRAIKSVLDALTDERKQHNPKKPLDVQYFDAESAKVWK